VEIVTKLYIDSNFLHIGTLKSNLRTGKNFFKS